MADDDAIRRLAEEQRDGARKEEGDIHVHVCLFFTHGCSLWRAVVLMDGFSLKVCRACLTRCVICTRKKKSAEKKKKLPWHIDQIM